MNPFELRTSEPGPRLDAKIGGTADRKFASFVRNRNLWITDVRSGTEFQLSQTTNQALGCGIAEFVMQEEFHRFTGYWWAPDNAQRILYVEIDEGPVEVVYLPQAGANGKLDEFRYPKTGTSNVTSDLCIVDFSFRDEGNVGFSSLLSKPSLLIIVLVCFLVLAFLNYRCDQALDGKVLAEGVVSLV